MVVEIILNEVLVERLKAVEEVQQVYKISIKFKFAYASSSFYHKFLSIFLNWLVNFTSIDVAVGSEDIKTFAELDHLANIIKDSLVPFVWVEFLCQRFVNVSGSFIIAEQEKVVSNLSGLGLLHIIWSFDHWFRPKNIEKFVLHSVGFFISFAQLFQPILNMLLNLQFLVTDIGF